MSLKELCHKWSLGIAARDKEINAWKDLISLVAVPIGVLWLLGSLYYQSLANQRNEDLHRTNVGKVQMKLKTTVLSYDENGLKFIRVDLYTKNIGSQSLKLHRQHGLRLVVKKMEPIGAPGIIPKWPDRLTINHPDANDPSNRPGTNLMPALLNPNYRYSLEPGQEYHDVDVVSVKEPGIYLIRVAYYRDGGNGTVDRTTDYELVAVE